MIKKFLLFTITAILLTSFAYAAVTINVPANDATVTGNNAINVSVTDNKGNFSCVIYFKSVSTANSTWSKIVTLSNNTIGGGWATGLNNTFNSALVEDSNDYLINASCYNLTAFMGDDTNTGIIVQNTVPTAPTSVSPSDNTLITSKGAQTFSGTVINAKTTGCTYTLLKGGTSVETGAATYSGSTCSFTKTFGSSIDNDLWSVILTASDGTDTASTTTTMNVQLAGIGGFNPEISEKSGTNSNMTIWVILGAVVIGYFLLKKKK